jgi:peptidoglycan/LPS O-acetylase OafA/YrhL
MIVINGGNLVQTFFFISGFLNSISLLSYVDRTRMSNFWVLLKAVIFRIVRFIPVLFFLALLHATWLHRLEDGPYWDKFAVHERQACRRNMWSNLLLINNYKSDEMKCMIHTWYIATDFHLSIIGTVLLLLVVK